MSSSETHQQHLNPPANVNVNNDTFHQGNVAEQANDALPQGDIPSVPGTRANTPILNLDDLVGVDPFGNGDEWFTLLNPNSNDGRTSNGDVGAGTSVQMQPFHALMNDQLPTSSNYQNGSLNQPSLNQDSLPQQSLNRGKRKATEDPLLVEPNDTPLPVAYTRRTSAGCASSSSSDTKSGSGFSKRKKKPKGMPKRPLSAYNLFFQSQRPRINAEHQQSTGSNDNISFEDLGKIVGKLWRELSRAEKKVYESLAQKDGERYRKEMDLYNELKKKRYEEEANRSLPTSASPMVAAAATVMASSPSPSALGSLTNPVVTAPEFPSPHHQRQVTGVSSAPNLHRGPPSYGVGPVPESGAPPPAPTLSYGVMDGNPITGVTHPSTGGRSSVPHSSASPQMAMHPHVPSQGTHGMGGASSIPPVVSFDGRNPIGKSHQYPLPPGMEIVLSDSHGVDRKYRVHYQCFSMTREAANQYLESLTGAKSFNGTSNSSTDGPRNVPDQAHHLPPNTPALNQTTPQQQTYGRMWGV